MVTKKEMIYFSCQRVRNVEGGGDNIVTGMVWIHTYQCAQDGRLR